MKSFERWWSEEGSAMRPMPTEDVEEFAKRIAEIAWSKRAYIFANQPEPVRDLYNEGFHSGLGISSSYKEEARAYKEAYFKLIENVASMKAFELAPPIVLFTPPAAQPEQRKPLTDDHIWKLLLENEPTRYEAFRLCESAHGIKEGT